MATIAVSGTKLYVGGRFTVAGGNVVNGMAVWDTAAQTWSGLGNKLFLRDGSVFDIVTYGPLVFIGGNFREVHLEGAGILVANGLLAWNSATDQWARITEGEHAGVVSPSVYALAVHGENLYVGGGFIQAGPVSTRGVARYNLVTRRWSALGGGLQATNPVAYALAVDGNSLYAGGSFEGAGGTPANNVARWSLDGESWTALGNGVTGRTGPAQENDVVVEAI